MVIRLLAFESTAGNEQPHVLLTFKLEAVETNISVCLCLESDLQSLEAGRGKVRRGRGRELGCFTQASRCAQSVSSSIDEGGKK